jgi:hypothetical protein
LQSEKNPKLKDNAPEKAKGEESPNSSIDKLAPRRGIGPKQDELSYPEHLQI